MNDKQNIEELFQKTFEGFEADVNPQVWQGIQQQLPSGQVTPGAEGAGAGSSSAGSFSAITSAAVVKVAAIVGVATALVAGGYWLSTDGASEQVQTAVEQPVETVMAPASTSDIVPEEATMEENSEQATQEIENEPVQQVVSERNQDLTPALPNQGLTEKNTGTVTSKQPEKGKTAAKENVVIDKATHQDVAKQPAKTTEAPNSTVDKQEEDKTKTATASIHASVKRGALPLVVHFSNNDPLATNVHWDFGDGNRSDALSPRHTFNEPGSYQVVLAVENKENVSHDTVLIVVHRALTMMIPNLFTPNGDGINDAFRVEVENVEQFHCRIMDRSGKTVYEMNNIHSHWDGRDKFGNTLNEGNYFYVIEATTPDGHSDVRKGVLMLKR